PTSGAPFQSKGLGIMEVKDYTVDVTVKGARNIIGSLTPESLAVTPSFGAITEAGVYGLPLVATKTNQLASFSIVSVYPKILTLTFDTAITKKFQIETDIIGLSAEKGYILENFSLSQSEVTLSGSEKIVNLVNHVSAVYTLNEVLTETKTIKAALKLYDANGTEIPTDSLRMDAKEVDITIPVYVRGELPLGIEFINVPEGFDITTLSYVMSRDKINIASSKANIDSIKKKTIGYIDLASFKIGETYTFSVSLGAGYANIDNVQSVTVTFPKENISSKKLNVSDIRIVNKPANFDVELMTKRINDVTVLGQRDDVEALAAGGVVAILDFNDFSAEKGNYSLPVSFKIPSSNSVWVAGSYTVVIEVTPK
ncbi:MAG: CdaR family protein, partial [Oscillospiraceae bacterium]